ncbi:unnamed protein product [Amoebophrya sp. A120]|nr:unnamed protein product [Amoebophrya sp. A120]|eukprot:GSA120T00004842001.1
MAGSIRKKLTSVALVAAGLSNFNVVSGRKFLSAANANNGAAAEVEHGQLQPGGGAEVISAAVATSQEPEPVVERHARYDASVASSSMSREQAEQDVEMMPEEDAEHQDAPVSSSPAVIEEDQWNQQGFFAEPVDAQADEQLAPTAVMSTDGQEARALDDIEAERQHAQREAEEMMETAPLLPAQAVSEEEPAQAAAPASDSFVEDAGQEVDPLKPESAEPESAETMEGSESQTVSEEPVVELHAHDAAPVDAPLSQVEPPLTSEGEDVEMTSEQGNAEHKDVPVVSSPVVDEEQQREPQWFAGAPMVHAQAEEEAPTGAMSTDGQEGDGEVDAQLVERKEEDEEMETAAPSLPVQGAVSEENKPAEAATASSSGPVQDAGEQASLTEPKPAEQKQSAEPIMEGSSGSQTGDEAVTITSRGAVLMESGRAQALHMCEQAQRGTKRAFLAVQSECRSKVRALSERARGRAAEAHAAAREFHENKTRPFLAWTRRAGKGSPQPSLRPSSSVPLSSRKGSCC